MTVTLLAPTPLSVPSKACVSVSPASAEGPRAATAYQMPTTSPPKAVHRVTARSLLSQISVTSQRDSVCVLKELWDERAIPASRPTTTSPPLGVNRAIAIKPGVLTTCAMC